MASDVLATRSVDESETAGLGETIRDLQRRLATSEAMVKALLVANLDAVVAAARPDPYFRALVEEVLCQGLADRIAVIEQLPCGVVVYDDAGRLLFANPAATDLSGDACDPLLLPAQSIALAPVDPLTHRMFALNELPVSRALLGEVVRSFECSLDVGHGTSERVLRMSAVPRVDDQGSVIGAICTLFDVSERARLQRDLIQSDRMACVGTLAAGVAHEINNPLAYILANVAFVAEETPAMLRTTLGPGAAASPRMQEIVRALSDAREGAERIRRVVSELKAFAQAEDDVRQRVDVRQCLEGACQVAETEIRHRARLVKTFAPVPAVLASEGRLRQLFLNLLMNAAQAVDEAATSLHEIRVSTSVASGGEVVVEVSDTGLGIAAAALPRVFDPFFALRATSATTGFGLATCESIATALGGRIVVESELGKGTVFRVLLPPHLETTTIPPRARRTRRGRILVIDDELAVTDSIKRVLGKDHDVTIALRAADALTLLAGADEFDLVLCDVMMPEMGGLELYAKISEVRPELLPRLAFMTGGAFTARARAFLESVPNARLSKPFDLTALREFVSARIQ